MCWKCVLTFWHRYTKNTSHFLEKESIYKDNITLLFTGFFVILESKDRELWYRMVCPAALWVGVSDVPLETHKSFAFSKSHPLSHDRRMQTLGEERTNLKQHFQLEINKMLNITQILFVIAFDWHIFIANAIIAISNVSLKK